MFLSGAASVGLLVAITCGVAFLLCRIDWGSGNALYKTPKKIADYLYSIEYNDYREDPDLEASSKLEAFGCSSVHNGNYYGRNFDYIFNDTPEFVVKVNEKDGRHASIGVAMHSGLREAQMSKGEYNKQLEIIPNFTLDGINDVGVIASINVVPGKDDMGEFTGTNPGAESLHVEHAVRYILNNANSADNAIELLGSRNLYGDAVGGEYYIHIMIADRNKTYIVEFIDNKMVAVEKTGDEQIMTNFYNNIPELTDHAAGIERYAILKENYEQGGASMSEMRNLMARVRYSNAYAYSTMPAWNSEMMPQSVLNNPDSEAYALYVSAVENIIKDYWIHKENDMRAPADSRFWHTTHNSVYDIDNRKLRITIQEDYKNYYDFTL